MSTDVAMQVRIWRNKAANGTLTREEMREGVILLRADRKKSIEVGEIKKAKKTTDVKGLLDDFAQQMAIPGGNK